METGPALPKSQLLGLLVIVVQRDDPREDSNFETFHIDLVWQRQIHLIKTSEVLKYVSIPLEQKENHLTMSVKQSCVETPILDQTCQAFDLSLSLSLGIDKTVHFGSQKPFYQNQYISVTC